MNNIDLICPICKEKLTLNNKTYSCTNNHCYDMARQGYVNLLPVQNKKSLNPGDNKAMLAARRNFLETDIYLPIYSSVISRAKKLIGNINKPKILDIGCGEGYYTKKISDSFNNCSCVGIDISKDGTKMACSRSKDIKWIVATASVLPVASDEIDLITAMFSLVAENEFLRVLKKGGYVIEVTAGNNHLIELKEIIYETVFEQHKAPSKAGFGFKEISREKESFKFTLNNKELMELLKMTPHFWRIHKERKEKLEQIESLSLTAEYWIRVMEKV